MSDDSWNPDADVDDAGDDDGHDGSPSPPPGGVAVKEEDDGCAYGGFDDDDSDREKLDAFYEEASLQKQRVLPSSSHRTDQLSQHSASMSLAELSRMESTVLSQSSHREEEDERQRRKAEKRARREAEAAGGVKVKRERRPPTEIQIKRQKEYRRFKYEKGTDLSEERDEGGSMEFLARRKLGEKSEQRRLRGIAKRREREKPTRARDGLMTMDEYEDEDRTNEREETPKPEDVKSGGEDGGPNWNFLEEGYVTMPPAEADKLPYYVYRNSKRKRSKVEGYGADGDAASTTSTVASSRSRRWRGSGHLMMLEHQGSAASSSVAATAATKRGRRRRRGTGNDDGAFANASNEQDGGARSFPLHFYQLKPRMDLHAMVDTTTPGSGRMVVAHGRNAKRLWTRMVAGGVTNEDFCNDGDEGDQDQTLGNANARDGDSVSNFSSSSSSSKSSVRSYQPTGVYSQMSYGTTSVMGMENVDDMINKDGVEGAATRKQQTPLLRLMSMVHGLPRSVQRTQLLLRVAMELGTSRRLWEDELKLLVEGCGGENTDNVDGDAASVSANEYDRATARFTAKERWAIKSFLGVDGGVPSWACDPSMPTHPTVLKQRVHGLRSSLLRRIRRRARSERAEVGAADDAGDGFKTAQCDGDASRLEAHSNDNGEETAEDLQQNESSAALKSEEACSDEEGMHATIADDGHPTQDEGNADEMHITPLPSLIDQVQRTNHPGGVDKYAKIIHESGIDTSNIGVALASFIDHLTSAKARLRHAPEADSSPFQSRQPLTAAQEEVGQWHDTIVSYLKLAETLTEVRDANFYKSGGSVPESAPLAQAVIATQSYFANGGGVGWGKRKKNKLQPASWEVKDEGHSSDESEASEPDDDEPETNESDQKAPSDHPEKRELRAIHLAAKELARRGKDRLVDDHVASFAQIHLTTGIATIAEHLPPPAAELLSRPCLVDSPDDRTPFDLMRKMVAMIEEDGSLISPPRASWDSRGKVIDETLVRSMIDAVMVFRRCIEKDPHNVDHWSWYVATLLGALCIALGSTAAVAAGANFNVKTEDGQGGRPRLECFHELRINSSVALQDILKYATSHGCPMFHLAVASMLEWERAMVLLRRPIPNATDQYCQEVKRLHAYHMFQWALACSESSTTTVRRLYESKHLPRDALLDVLARAVERDPCERKNWLNLVEALGPIAAESNHVCAHVAAFENGDRRSWRNTGRATEWEDEFFRSPQSAEKAVKPEFVRIVSSAVDGALASTKMPSLQQLTTNVHDDEEVSFPCPDECMGWIWNPLEDQVDTSAYEYANDVFPTEDAASSTPESRATVRSKFPEHLSYHPSCEATCMKILVACHLIGPWHPFVCNSIWWLSVKLWRSNQKKHLLTVDNPYADGLAWLSVHGLQTSTYLQCRMKNMIP